MAILLNKKMKAGNYLSTLIYNFKFASLQILIFFQIALQEVCKRQKTNS